MNDAGTAHTGLSCVTSSTSRVARMPRPRAELRMPSAWRRQESDTYFPSMGVIRESVSGQHSRNRSLLTGPGSGPRPVIDEGLRDVKRCVAALPWTIRVPRRPGKGADATCQPAPMRGDAGGGRGAKGELGLVVAATPSPQAE